MFTASFIIQVIAALSIPMSLLVVVYARTATKSTVRLQDLRMAILFSVIPATVILTLRAITPWWTAVLVFTLAAILAFIPTGNSE